VLRLDFELRAAVSAAATPIGLRGPWNQLRSCNLSIPRDELVRRLAEVSHLSYVRQKNRDHGVPLSELSLEVTDHDRERAEDVVAELERLGVYRESGVGPSAAQREEAGRPVEPEVEPVADEADPGEKRRQPVTDLWGNPLGSRRRKR
jgi:hypothetical protein